MVPNIQTLPPSLGQLFFWKKSMQTVIYSGWVAAASHVTSLPIATARPLLHCQCTTGAVVGAWTWSQLSSVSSTLPLGGHPASEDITVIRHDQHKGINTSLVYFQHYKNKHSSLRLQLRLDFTWFCSWSFIFCSNIIPGTLESNFFSARSFLSSSGISFCKWKNWIKRLSQILHSLSRI